jgi:quinol monooxygenase YgiN
MSKVSVMAKLTAAPGKRDELAEALRALTANADTEPGTIAYSLHADNADANVLWMFELYADDAALATHGSSDVFKAAGKTLAPFLAARPELNFCKPLHGKGL